MQLTQTDAQRRLAELGMENMPIISVRPTPAMVPADWFARWKDLTRSFVASLTDSVQDLAFLNLSQDEFVAFMMGQRIPDNMSFRMRIPLVWGGKLEIENMFMCHTFPHAQNMDLFILEQIGASEVWLPNPAKKIYLPTQSLTGGEGGNATEDRLSQIAAQISSNRGME